MLRFRRSLQEVLMQKHKNRKVNKTISGLNKLRELLKDDIETRFSYIEIQLKSENLTHAIDFLKNFAHMFLLNEKNGIKTLKYQYLILVDGGVNDLDLPQREWNDKMYLTVSKLLTNEGFTISKRTYTIRESYGEFGIEGYQNNTYMEYTFSW